MNNIYREMSEPQEKATATANVSAFWGGMEKIREQYHIADIVCMVSVNVIGDDGVEYQSAAAITFGDLSQHEIMAARLLGSLQAERQERIGKALADIAVRERRVK